MREEVIEVAFAKSHPSLAVVWTQDKYDNSRGVDNAESEDCVYAVERTRLELEEDVDRALLFERKRASYRTLLERIVVRGQSPERTSAARRHDTLDEISRPKA